MKKINTSWLVMIASILTAVSIVPVVARAQTSTVVCPEGYVCTPIPSQPINCPSGYFCEPVTPITPVPTPSVCYVFSINLTLGSTGAEVVALQTWLMGHGYVIPSIANGTQAKGYFGAQTAYALSKYQKANNISEMKYGSAYFGPVTRQKINESCGSTSTQSRVTILTPNGGETFSSNGTMNVSWITNDAQGPVRLHLLSYPNNVDYYSSGPQGAGTGKDGTVLSGEALNVPSGTYRMQVCDEGVKGGACDESDSYFRITSAIKIGTDPSPLSEKVRSLYLTLQCREPDTQGWQYWSNMGSDYYSIQNGMMAGIEYQVKQQIRQVFQQILGRQPGCEKTYMNGISELHYWYEKVYNGNTGQVNLDVLRSGIGGVVTQPTLSSLNVSLGMSSPISSTLSTPQSNVTLAVIDLRAGQNPVTNMNSIQIASDSQHVPSVLGSVKVYLGSTVIGSLSSNWSWNGSYYYQWLPVSGITVPANSTVSLRLMGDLSYAIDERLRLGIAGLNFTTPGALATGLPTYGSEMKLVGTAQPVVAKPSVTMTSSAEAAAEGKTVTVKWSSTNSTACSLRSGNKDGAFVGFSGPIATSGSISSIMTGQAETVTITCTGPGGSDTANTTIEGWPTGSSGYRTDTSTNLNAAIYDAIREYYVSH